MASRRLREQASEYADSSISPNGDRNSSASGCIPPRSGFTVTMAERVKPVDQPAKSPQAAPNPGMNMGNASARLCRNMPHPSIPRMLSRNWSTSSCAPSSVCSYMEPA